MPLKLGKQPKPDKKEIVGSKPLKLPVEGGYSYEVPSLKKKKKAKK